MNLVCPLPSRKERGLIVAVGFGIRRTARFRCDDKCTLGADAFEAGGACPSIAGRAAEDRSSKGIVRSTIDGGPHACALRLHRQDLYHATQCPSAVEIAGRAADDFDAIDRRLRDAVPVDPAAE